MSEIPTPAPAVPLETYVASGSLILVSPKVILATEEKEPPAPNPYRLVNSILVAVLFGLITFWFVVHLKTFVTQFVILGTVTAASLLQVFISQFKTAVGDDAKQAWQKFLDHPVTYGLLRVLILVVLVLFIVTSSIHVKLGNTDVSTVKIEVLDAETNEAFMTPIALKFGTKTAGAPVFPHLSSKKLLLRLKSPPGYHPEQLTLRPGEPLELSFPEDFQKRSLVRIFIPLRLKTATPQEGDVGFPESKLVIDAAGRPGAFLKFGFRSGYVGVGDADLARDLIAHALPAFEEERRMEVRGSADDQHIEQALTRWRNAPAVSDAWDLRDGDIVSAVLRMGEKDLFRCSARVTQGKITDCILTEAR